MKINKKRAFQCIIQYPKSLHAFFCEDNYLHVHVQAYSAWYPNFIPSLHSQKDLDLSASSRTFLNGIFFTLPCYFYWHLSVQNLPDKPLFEWSNLCSILYTSSLFSHPSLHLFTENKNIKTLLPPDCWNTSILPLHSAIIPQSKTSSFDFRNIKRFK